MDRWEVDETEELAILDARSALAGRPLLLGALLGCRDLLVRAQAASPPGLDTEDRRRLRVLLELTRRLWIDATAHPEVRLGIPGWLTDGTGQSLASVGDLALAARRPKDDPLRRFADEVDTRLHILGSGQYALDVEGARQEPLQPGADLGVWRSTVPVPVQDENRRGVILNVALVDRGAPRPGSGLATLLGSTTMEPRADFAEAVDHAIRCADLAMGRVTDRAKTLYVPGMLTFGTQVIEESCGLPVALAVIAETLHLPLPADCGVLATGVLEADGSLRVMDADGGVDVHGKIAAVQALAAETGPQLPIRWLWYAGEDGLMEAPASGGEPVVRRACSGPLTVAVVAEALWGTAFLAARARPDRPEDEEVIGAGTRVLERLPGGASRVVDLDLRLATDRGLQLVLSDVSPAERELQELEDLLMGLGPPFPPRRWIVTDDLDALAARCADLHPDHGIQPSLVLRAPGLDPVLARARHIQIANRAGLFPGPTIVVTTDPSEARLGGPTVLIEDPRCHRAEALDALVAGGLLGTTRIPDLLEQHGGRIEDLLAAAVRYERRLQQAPDGIDQLLAVAGPLTRARLVALGAHVDQHAWAEADRGFCAVVIGGRGDPGITLASLPRSVLEEDYLWDTLLQQRAAPALLAQLVALPPRWRGRIGLNGATEGEAGP